MVASSFRPRGLRLRSGIVSILFIWSGFAAAADPQSPPRRLGENYPAAAASTGRHGSTIVGFDIAESGRVENCTTVRSSGTPVLDSAACALIGNGTVFKVDTPPAGTPLQRMHSESTVHWAIAGAAQTADDLPIGGNDIVVPYDPMLARHNRGRTVAREPVRGALPVDNLPEGVADGRGGKTAVVLTIDPRGRVIGCGLARSSGTPDLDRKTCDFARQLRYRPAADAGGRALHGLDLFTFNWAPAVPAGEAPPVSVPANP